MRKSHSDMVFLHRPFQIFPLILFFPTFLSAGGLVNPAYETHPDDDDDGFTDSDQEDASQPTEVEKVIVNPITCMYFTSEIGQDNYCRMDV